MDGAVTGLHDIAEGGLALAVGEMAVSSGVGFQIAGPDSVGLFSEAPSRVVVSLSPAAAAGLVERAGRTGVPVADIGRGGGDRLVVDGVLDIPWKLPGRPGRTGSRRRWGRCDAVPGAPGGARYPAGRGWLAPWLS